MGAAHRIAASYVPVQKGKGHMHALMSSGSQQGSNSMLFYKTVENRTAHSAN